MEAKYPNVASIVHQLLSMLATSVSICLYSGSGHLQQEKSDDDQSLFSTGYAISTLHTMLLACLHLCMLLPSRNKRNWAAVPGGSSHEKHCKNDYETVSPCWPPVWLTATWYWCGQSHDTRNHIIQLLV